MEEICSLSIYFKTNRVRLISGKGWYGVPRFSEIIQVGGLAMGRQPIFGRTAGWARDL